MVRIRKKIRTKNYFQLQNEGISMYGVMILLQSSANTKNYSSQVMRTEDLLETS
jgi:hypothetical protein